MYEIRSLSAVWNHHVVMYVINPKEDTRRGVMPYAFGDYILTCGEITCQSFGLDRKKTVRKRSFFLAPPAGLVQRKQSMIVFSNGVAQSPRSTRRVYRAEAMRHTTATGENQRQPAYRIAVLGVKPWEYLLFSTKACDYLKFTAR